MLRLCTLQMAPHFNEELAKAGEAVGLAEGGFIPPNPSWVLWRQAPACPESQSVGPAYMGFFFFPCSWSRLSGVLEAFSFLLGA